MKKHNGLSFFMPKAILLLGCVFLTGCIGGSDPESDSSALQDDAVEGILSEDVVASIAERYTNPTEYKQAIHTAQSIQVVVNSSLLNDTPQEQAVRDLAISFKCLMQTFDNHHDAIRLVEMEALETDEEYKAYEQMIETHHEVFGEDTNTSDGECL